MMHLLPERARRPGAGPTAVALLVAVIAVAAAAAGWTSALARDDPRVPSVRIVDVRPLRAPDAALRDLITHTFAVRVAITGWQLLPYQPGATADDNRPGAGHWRLYVDGHPLGDTLGDRRVSYTTYLPPGTHWAAAELSNADSTSLDPPVWSEPVVLYVPRVVRCWQTGWNYSSGTKTPKFTCPRGNAAKAR